MAIEVIGEDDSVYLKATCPQCAAVLRYLPIDVKEKRVSDYSGDADLVRYIPCPKCGHHLRYGHAD